MSAYTLHQAPKNSIAGKWESSGATEHTKFVMDSLISCTLWVWLNYKLTRKKNT